MKIEGCHATVPTVPGETGLPVKLSGVTGGTAAVGEDEHGEAGPVFNVTQLLRRPENCVSETLNKIVSPD